MQNLLAWIICILMGLLILVLLRLHFSKAMRTIANFVCDTGTSPTAFNGLVQATEVPMQYAGDPMAWPKVTIIAPGRNEGHVLRRTLGALCELDYPNYRVIFVDDQSTDDTADICRDLAVHYSHLQVIHHTQCPPDDWGGKVWAIQQAVPLIDGELVLFTDSDIWHHPQSLRKMVQLQRHRNLDMLSLLPRMETGGMLEQAVMIVAQHALLTLAPLYRSNDPRNPTPLTGGAYMLFRTSAYRFMGGHEAIHKMLVEDLALGTRARSLGLNVFTICTHELLSGRMYEGMIDTFRGLKKNAYSGLRCSPVVAVFTALVMLLAGAFVPLYLILAVIGLITHPAFAGVAALLLALVVNILFFTYFERLRRVTSQDPWTPLFIPPAILFCLGVLVGSMWDYYVRGGSVWSGHLYARKEVNLDAAILTGPPIPTRET